MIRTLNAAFALLVACSFARADTFYVEAGSGNDSNDGSSATPFKTIQRAIDAATAPSSTVKVNPGTYAEALTLSKSSLHLVGVGRAVVESPGTGILVTGDGNTIENMTFRRCVRGTNISGASNTFLRCVFTECSTGVLFEGRGTNTLFRECTVCCNNSLGMYLWTNRVSLERCTIAKNGGGIVNFSQEYLSIRNCILAFNTGTAVQDNAGYQTPVFASNDFFGNGRDYTGSAARPTDLAVDPQFIDLDGEVLSLKSASPLVNAGQEDLPVTIGAHEIGTVASAAASADVPFNGWMDSGGRPVTDAAAQVVLGVDGFLRLNGVATASALSPVIDLGDSAAVTTNAEFRALEDAMATTVSKRVVDSDNATFAREFEARSGDSPFGALDASPAWASMTTNASLNLRGRYVQIRMTLTTQGK